MSEYFISQDDANSDLLAAAAFVGERIKSSDGHAEAIAAVIPQYLANDNVDLAAELANSIDDPYTRDRLLILVAEKCAELDDDEYAVQLADAVEDDGLRSQAFERIGLQKAAKGQLDKAREIAAQMLHPDAVHAAVAVQLAEAGDQEAAAEEMELVEYSGAAVAALEEMAAAKLRSGNGEDAQVFLEQAAVKAGEIEHAEEKIRAYIGVANLFVEAGQKGRAVEIFERARAGAEALDNVHRDNLLGLASLGFLHAGSVELADRSLDLVADKTQMASCLLGYSRQYWNQGERSEAIDALEESYSILRSQHERETRSSREKFSLFATIAAQFAGFEKGGRAIDIAQEIADEDSQTQALQQIAEILTIRKEDEQARQALRAIADDANRVEALIKMSDAKEKNGERDAAKAMLEEAVLLAETVPQLAARSAAYSAIAARLREFGDAERADETFRTNLEVIAEIRDESNRARSLAQLAASNGDAIPESGRELLRSIVAKA